MIEILSNNNIVKCLCGTIFKFDSDDLYISDQSYSDSIMTVRRVYKSVDCPTCKTRSNVIKV